MIKCMGPQMQFEDVGTMPARVLFSHSRVGAGMPFEPLGEASLTPEGPAAGGRGSAAAPQLHHVFQLGRDVPVVHQFLRAVLVGHVAPARAAGEGMSVTALAQGPAKLRCESPQSGQT